MVTGAACSSTPCNVNAWLLQSAMKLRRLCFYTCVSVHRGVCLSACWDTTCSRSRCPLTSPPQNQAPSQDQTPPGAGTPLQQGPRDQIPPGPGTPQDQASPQPPWDQAPPNLPNRRLLLRTVCILLECILVQGVWLPLSIMRTLQYVRKGEIMSKHIANTCNLMYDVIGIVWALSN